MFEVWYKDGSRWWLMSTQLFRKDVAMIHVRNLRLAGVEAEYRKPK